MLGCMGEENRKASWAGLIGKKIVFGPWLIRVGKSLSYLSNIIHKNSPIRIQIKFDFCTVPTNKIKYKSTHQSK
jgi:hypothetical protein